METLELRKVTRINLKACTQINDHFQRRATTNPTTYQHHPNIIKMEEETASTNVAEEQPPKESAGVEEEPKIEETPADTKDEPSDGVGADTKDMDDPSEDVDEEKDDEPVAKPAAKKAEEAPAPATVGGRAKRERKTVKAFNPEEYVEEKKEVVIPDGSGDKLEDIPNVVENFKAVTWSDPHLKMLYSLVFGGRGKKKEFKKHLLEFSGLVYAEGTDTEEEREKMKDKMYKLTMPELKAVMDLVDVNRSGDSFKLGEGKSAGKEEHCQRLLEWLEKPHASGKKKGALAKKSSGKRKSSGSAASAKKEKKEKKAPAKKAKKTPPAAKKKSSAKKVSAEKASSSGSESEDEPVLSIPGVDIDKVRAKVKSIVEKSDKDELTVKGVRKMLEEWLDTDLSKSKDAVRAIVMEVM